MSRIPNSAMPHAWAEDSDHTAQARGSRGKRSDERPSWLQLGVLVGLAYLGLKFAFGFRRHA